MGERKDDRAAIDRVTRRIMSDGVAPKKANELARKVMRKTDAKLREQGKR